VVVEIFAGRIKAGKARHRPAHQGNTGQPLAAKECLVAQ
jgi:hypothetical protein